MNVHAFKQGYLQTKLLFWISNYYYLDNHNFFKFQNEQTHTPSEVISLESAKVTGPERQNEYFYFTLHKQDYETTFRVSSLEDAKEWVEKINYAINLLKHPQPFPTHQTLLSQQDEEQYDQIKFENLDLNWKLQKIYDKLRLSSAEINQTQYLKGEWDINQPVKVLRKIFQSEDNVQFYQPFMKKHKTISQNQFEQEFQIQIGKRLHNKKRMQIKISFQRKQIIKSNYIIIQRMIFDSQLNEINLQIQEDSQYNQKSQCLMIVSFKKSKDKLIHKFIKEYMINHQIINYEWENIYHHSQTNSEVQKININNQPNTVEGLEIYFQPSDRLGFIDQNSDKNHPAFQYEEKHLRFTILNDKEKEILNQFRLRMKKIALNDNALIRHLQARQFDLDAAEKILTDVLEWRKKNNINNLDSNSSKFDFFRKQNVLIMLGEGKFGHPIFYIRAEVVLPELYQEPNPTLDVFIEYFCSLMEYNIRNMRGHIDCQILIIDCFNLSRKNVSIDLIKAVMGCVFMKYPERQIRNIIINTDWLAKSIYNLVKKFLPKRTIEKMAFAGQEIQDIQQVLLRDIDLKTIPRKYGGMNDLII